jgi:phosphate starvation-inducible PhoH-like protein
MSKNWHRRNEGRDRDWREQRDDNVLKAIQAAQADEVRKPTLLTRIKPLTPGQAQYFEAVANSDIVLVTGPAGTGKTLVGAGLAAEMLAEGRIDSLVLARPLVECGSKVGFLPGDLKDKVRPHMMALMNALGEFFSAGDISRLERDGLVSVQPLEYMRGTTFKRCWVILDEGQNASKTQTLMLLSRLGDGAKIIITGDARQRDIHEDSGFVHALRVLRHPRIGRVFLTKEDIVRHGIVRVVLEQWDTDGAEDE